jgi:hypothetical protein
MAKNKEQENSDAGSDIDMLLEQQLATVKNDSVEPQTSKKPVRAMKTINADGRLLAAYEALRKEGYKKSFDDFLVDASMFFAKGKYGLDFVIEKSLTPDDSDQYLKVRRKDDNDDENNGKSNNAPDSFDMALKLLTGGGSSEDPRVQVLNVLLEQKRLDMEERRIRMEREQLENERIKAEIEKLKMENKKPPVEETTEKRVDGKMEILKFIFDQNQKFYQTMADLYKSGSLKQDNGNSQLELYKPMAEQQKEYYQTISSILQNQQAEKISELERYVASLNPSVWLTQKAEEFKTFAELFGGRGGKTPEEIEREYQLRLEELRMKHEDIKEQREAERAMQITQTIKDGFSAFSEQIGKPLGEAIASRLRESNQPKMNTNMPSQPPEPNNVNAIKSYKIPLNSEEHNTTPNISTETYQPNEQQLPEYDVPITAYVKKTETKTNSNDGITSTIDSNENINGESQ